MQKKEKNAQIHWSIGGKNAGVLICHYFMIFISDARLFALTLY